MSRFTVERECGPFDTTVMFYGWSKCQSETGLWKSIKGVVMKPIPLRLFLLAHPQSESAGLLAQELMWRFVVRLASRGLRVPVFSRRLAALDGDEWIDLNSA